MPNLGDLLGGRYRLEREIGRGGFARVYLAADSTLDRRVAIKVLNAELTADATFLGRFEREAKQVANLDHPHILPIFDYGYVDGTAYVVMPYIASGTLADRLALGEPLSLQAISGYLQQAAAALDYAHARRIIHRDVKPQNMLMREGEQLYLADFGIAKVLQDTQGVSSTQAIGTLAYMAPEAFRGIVSQKSDVYALGCLLFEIVNGTPPFTGSSHEVLYGHVLAPVPNIAARLQVRGYPADMQRILEWALAKDPATRCPSAGELAAAVRALAQDRYSEFSRRNNVLERTVPVHGQADQSPVSQDRGSLPDEAPLPQGDRKQGRRDTRSRRSRRVNVTISAVAVTLAVAIFLAGSLRIWRAVDTARNGAPTIAASISTATTARQPTPLLASVSATITPTPPTATSVPPTATPTLPTATLQTGGITAAATSSAVSGNSRPLQETNAFSVGLTMYITYTVQVRAGEFVDLKLYRDGQPIDFKDTHVFENSGIYYGVRDYLPTVKGTYRVELYLNGAASPSRVLTFYVY